MSLPPAPDVLVAGLTLRIVPEGGDPYLGGPVPAAAAGAAAMGMRPACRTAVGNDLSAAEERMMSRLCGPDGLARVAAPQPVMAAPALMGASSARVAREAILRFAYPAQAAPPGLPLVLLNGDPERHLELIRASWAGVPILLDCYRDWLVVRRQAMAACIRASAVVTATEAELELMPADCRVAIADLLGRGGILVRKNGAAGVVVEGGGEKRVLPAPDVGAVVTDVGAGDLLAGALATALPGALGGGAVRVERTAAAYLAARPLLSELLAGSRPWTEEGVAA